MSVDRFSALGWIILGQHFLLLVRCILPFVMYTLSDKNPSAWNFLSPEPEVTCGTVAIIIRVPPLALLLCKINNPLYLLQLAASWLQGHLPFSLTQQMPLCLSSPFMPTTSSNSPPACYPSVLRTCIPVFCNSQPRKMRFTYSFRCVLKLFPIIV
jgi:hypothetical protein